MLTSIVRFCHRHRHIAFAVGLAQALFLATPTLADDRADFHAAIEGVLDQYHFTLSVLETSSQEQTASEVSRLRQMWQSIASRFGARRPEAFADDDGYGGLLLQVDVSLVGVLLVIELGNRDGARSALSSIEDTLTRLAARSAPQP